MLLVLPAGAAGCGGGGGAERPAASSTGSTPATTPAAAAPSPARTLADVKTALRGVRSFHIDGVQLDADGRTRLAGDFTAAGSLRLHLAVGRSVADLVVVHDVTYVKANQAYWLSQGKGPAATKVAQLLAGRWAKLPAAAAGSFKDDLEQLSPKGLAECVSRGNGTLSSGGVQTLDGRRVRVLIDKGDKPGTNPGRLYVAADGKALPLREVQTGRQRPGGTDTRCGDPKSTTRQADVRISRYDLPVKITPPRGALDLDRLQSGLDPGATPS